MQAATKFFNDQYNTVELGGLEQLQAKQIPNAYIADTPEVAAAKEAFQATFKAAEMGKHADLQAGQIANAYIDDTEDVAVAKAAHMAAVEAAAAAAAMEPTEGKMSMQVVVLNQQLSDPPLSAHLQWFWTLARVLSKCVDTLPVNTDGNHSFQHDDDDAHIVIVVIVDSYSDYRIQPPNH